ncbi:hypothetical protein SAMN05660642_04911 [Geodermatophilus siccatus]|uniref:Uncharacterized protein n=1 Tax=Geodermatophilus siccatus TaxID=1137991 RepID=A0A1H0BPH5_9ACTN|nr:hypothetical protein [Geodermatophilus siccatus]SDN47560.1 hypothetical protein SAMN05660642_04911 [Geodermatophilus siccatus]
MDLTRGYNLSPSVQSRLRLLDWIADNGGKTPGAIVDLGPLFDRKDQEGAMAVAGNLEALEAQGLLRLQKTLGWAGWSGDVLPPGLDLIEDVAARRGDRLRRRQAARDAFLHWLFDCTLDGNEYPDSDDFSSSKYGAYYGEPFTEQDISAASQWLRDEGYLHGTTLASGDVVNAMITTRGQKVVESERSVNAETQQPAPYSVTTVNITGSGNNVAANSSNVSQTTTVQMTEDNSRQLLGLAESLAQLTNSGLLGLTEDQSREAALVVESLRETAELEAAPGGDVRTLLDKAKEVALAGTGTAIGQTLVAAVDQVIQALGLG